MGGSLCLQLEENPHSREDQHRREYGINRILKRERSPQPELGMASASPQLEESPHSKEDQHSRKERK